MAKKYWLFIGICFCILLTLLVVLVLHRSTPSPQPSPPLPTPTPIVINQTKPYVQYQQEASQKLVDKTINRRELSAADQTAKKNLLTKLQNKSGIVYTSNDFQISYLHSPDLFQVEITDPSIDETKQQAVDWFLSHGFTQDGVCDLPVMFFLSGDVSQAQPKNTEFSPIAAGC